MRVFRSLIAALAIAAAILFACIQSAHAQDASARLFGELPLIADAAISPDGESIAMLQSTDGQTFVVFYDTANQQAPVAVQLGEARARDMIWASNEKLLLFVTNTQSVNLTSGLQQLEVRRYFSLDRNTGKTAIMLSNAKGSGYIVVSAGSLLHTWPQDEKYVLIAQYDPSRRAGQNTHSSDSRVKRTEEPGGYNLYKVNVNNGRESTVERGNSYTDEWIVDGSGRAVGRVDFDADSNERRIYARLDGGKRFTEVASYKELPGQGRKFTFVGAGSDPMRPIVRSYDGADTLGLFEYDLAKGEISTPLFRNDDLDLDGALYDSAAATIIGASYIDDFPRNKYFDPKRNALIAQLEGTLSGAAVSIASETLDRSMAIVRAAYNDRPTEFYLYDKSGGRLENLGSSYPAEAAGVGVRERFETTASDGLVIPGYLTKPSGKAAQNLPLIVLPHGGPEGRDDMSFDWWAAFYASHGYAVYQPNFRGSDGYGFSYREAGFGEWGRNMQDDITSGVNKLVSTGVADPARICIVGASYGGYAALAGATLTPELYACAVSVNGVSDLIHMLSGERRSGEYSLAFWEKRIGDLGRERIRIEAVSPVRNVDNIKAPVLLIHGKDDTVVPISHSRRMRDAMKSAGKSVAYSELDSEDHWLSSGATRTKMLEQSITFIDKHIGQ